MKYVIGIDIGTSGIKAAAMDSFGTLHFLCRCDYELEYYQGGRIEINPDTIWRKTYELIKQISREVYNNEGRVASISFSTFCNASIWMDNFGNSIGKGILYLDHRSKKETEIIKQKVPENTISEITGNRLEPGMISISNLIWVKNHEPEKYEKAFKWGHLATFLTAKLTGRYVMDWTHASLTGLFDIKSYKWSEELINKLGINPELLPEITNPLEIIGDITPGLAKEFGFTGVHVICGAADTACSAYALDIRPGEIFDSAGTSDVITVAVDNPDSFDSRFLNRCHIEKGIWLSHGVMSTPGAAIRWFYQEFLSNSGELNEVFQTLPEQSPVGSNGVMFLPYMHGERSPIWDSHARGGFIGLSLNSSKEDMGRAILEGCSFGLRQVMEIVLKRFNISATSMVLTGGGSKNMAWNQIKADILQKTLYIKEMKETALVGACQIAYMGLGINIKEVIKRQEDVFLEITPDTNKTDKYNELYELYLQLYPALKSFYMNHSDLNKMNIK